MEFLPLFLAILVVTGSSNASSDPPKPNYDTCKLLKNEERLDCFPSNNANQDACEARGCCWIPATNLEARSNDSLDAQSILDTPYCFFQPDQPGYKISSVQKSDSGITATLVRTYKSAYPKDIETLQLTVTYETEDRLRVKITDPNKARYEVPYPTLSKVNSTASSQNYVVDVDQTSNNFRVLRKTDSAVLFDSMNFINFIYADQFIQFGAKLPSKYIYGIGEHTGTLQLSTNWARYTLFAHDVAPDFNRNLYGSHPFYLSIEESGNAHGVFLFNSNAMDVMLQASPAITFRTVGGILDFYFFMGPTPADVVRQYIEMIGRPYMPPFWSLGFHLCRYGYKTLENTKATLQRNLDAGIPIDTQWNDLDYMANSNDFTYDQDKFAGLPEFVADLHSKGMHYTVLVDCGISAGETPGSYEPYETGIQMDVFVKNTSGMPFIGKVWNAHSTVWPDFTHPSAKDYWLKMFTNFYKVVPFDGAWIDMNEPSNFINGGWDGCPQSDYDSPPYIPAVDGGSLNSKTLCMSAQQHAGVHYNVHNLYGFTEAIVTSQVMSELRGKRPLVISRSTFAGHGHFAGHWSGDVFSTWDTLKQSIPHILSFSLFGVPLMGADICGFIGDSNAALCNRWQQLGAFYPFSRNHNNDASIDQDPVAMGNTVVASTKKALQIRYSLLPYLYTLFYKAHINGDTVARPLFIEFPNDSKTYGLDTQFLWGAGFMIAPVLTQDATSVNAYLPNSIWYDYYTRQVVATSAGNVTLSAPEDTIPLLLRGGYILPIQGSGATTTVSRKTKIELLVSLDSDGKASGDFFWDDGEGLDTIESEKYSYITFTLANGSLKSKTVKYAGEAPPNLGKVTVLGVATKPNSVQVNIVSRTFTYDSNSKVLTVEDLDIPFANDIQITYQ